MFIVLLIELALLFLLGWLGVHFICKPFLDFFLGEGNRSLGAMRLYQIGRSSNVRCRQVTAMKYLPEESTFAPIPRGAQERVDLDLRPLFLSVHDKDRTVMRNALSSCVKVQYISPY
jgi:hypothetical protein